MKSPQSKLSVRTATVEDVEAILHIHRAAVHEFGSYVKVILDEWSPDVNLKRIETVKKSMIENPEGELWLLAESEGQIVGFGSIVPKAEELRACYVLPSLSGKGVGERILKELELLARRNGLKRLQLDSSLNAKGFYLRHGYQVDRTGTHIMRSGRSMDCLHMSKELGSQ